MNRESITVKIFADGANKEDMIYAYKNKLVHGFTTNPTLMRKAGVTHYENFAKEILGVIVDLPISFEVFSDEPIEMERQARKIYSWAKNIHVKIPIINTQGQSSIPLIKKISHEGIPVNVTAILTLDQVEEVSKALHPNTDSIVSVFAGRIADTGVDPLPIMKKSHELLKHLPKAELLWASSREVFNIVQAQESGCQIITVTPDILKKMSMLGKELIDVSLDTVKTFYEDSQKSGFNLN